MRFYCNGLEHCFKQFSGHIEISKKILFITTLPCTEVPYGINCELCSHWNQIFGV